MNDEQQPLRRRPYLRSGLYARPELPDQSTPIGAILAERRAGLVADLGGDLTTAQTALVDLAIRQWALLESVDALLLSLPSPVDKRHRRCWGVVADRNRLAAELRTTLTTLGLDRKAQRTPGLDVNRMSLQEYIALPRDVRTQLQEQARARELLREGREG